MHLDGMNIVLFITDQERRVMDFPPGWAEANLPGMNRLKRHGLSFQRAFTNSCMCSPARATLLSGFFPAQHGVKYTLEQDMSEPDYPQVTMPLPNVMPNLATVVSSAGFDPIYKGKFHVTKYTGARWEIPDIGQYGFQRWNPQDAGANQDVDEESGGKIQNDARFMYLDGPDETGMEGAHAFLKKAAHWQQPFFLVVSLVNPHDVLFYPSTFTDGGYDDAWLQGDIQPPGSANEDLSNKPRVQAEFIKYMAAGMGTISDASMQANYLNFYGNLMKLADSYLVGFLDLMDELKLTDNTLIIRTADHGEMGMSHGGARQKCFNFYEQSTSVPLIYSNPRLYPEPVVSEAMVSHVDFLPTIAGLVGAPPAARANWQGRDYSEIVTEQSSAPVQDYVVFTFDDYQVGQTSPSLPPPNHIVSIREERYKLAEYYDADGKIPSEWEMYDLQDDPDELRNLAHPGCQRDARQQLAYDRLMIRLQEVKQTRLQPWS